MKLKTYLAAHGLSNAAFAAKVGVSTETVRLWLRQPDRMPQGRFMARIIEATDGAVSALDFLDPAFVRGEQTEDDAA